MPSRACDCHPSGHRWWNGRDWHRILGVKPPHQRQPSYSPGNPGSPRTNGNPAPAVSARARALAPRTNGNPAPGSPRTNGTPAPGSRRAPGTPAPGSATRGAQRQHRRWPPNPHCCQDRIRAGRPEVAPQRGSGQLVWVSDRARWLPLPGPGTRTFHHQRRRRVRCHVGDVHTTAVVGAGRARRGFQALTPPPKLAGRVLARSRPI